MALDPTLDALPAGIVVLDRELRIVSLNAAYHRVMGLPEGFAKPGDPIEKIVRHLASLASPDPEAAKRAADSRMAHFEARKGFTYHRPMHDGRWVEVVSTMLPDGGQVLLHLDVTESQRQIAELARVTALRESEAQLLRAIDGLSTGVCLYDAADRMVLCNAAYRSILALPPAIGPGSTFREVLETQIESGVANLGGLPHESWLAERLRQHNLPGDKNFEVSASDGRTLQVRDQRLSGGGYALTVTDITEAREHRGEIERQTQILARTFESIDEGIVVYDSDRKLIAWNDRARQILDVSPDIMRLGLRFEDAIRFQAARGDFGPNADVEAEVARRVARASSALPYSDEGWRSNGRYIVTRRTPLPGGGWVTLFADLTARKHAEDDLRQAKDQAETASRTKSEFLANMSHELRTPLNAVIGFSEIIHRQIFGPIGEDRYVDYAKDIHASGTHLLQVINDILDISKAEAGKVDLRETPVDVARALAACAKLLAPRAEAGQVRVEIDVPEDAPLLLADEQRLRQIVLNLMSNAVKFTPPGGRVTAGSARDADGALRLTVSDTGIGMREQDIPRALEPFGQIDSALARRFEGTGLGLPLTKKLVELHGGTLELRSRPGDGTAAIVRFPPARSV
jgi:signal transduction histidine kinase